MDAHNLRRKHFNPLSAKVCPQATPHSLRHEFATIRLEEGAPTKVVSVQLGHTFTRITEDTYSHVTARLQKEAGDAIERVLGM
jgi:integrase